jgi:hypothetical protein
LYNWYINIIKKYVTLLKNYMMAHMGIQHMYMTSDIRVVPEVALDPSRVFWWGRTVLIMALIMK